ncbi:MAG: alpha/beta fold hydrolase [Candidatus Bathyarchaeia archaeon]
MEHPFFFRSSSYQLAAVLHTPTVSEGKSPCIVMCHGYTGNKAEAHRLFVQAARRFAADGFAVLRFDFRGHGDSEGGFEETTFSGELEDFAHALDVVEDEPSVDASRIGVVGLSLGGAVALCGSASDKRLSAIVAWSTPATLMSFSQMALKLPLVVLRPGVEAYEQPNGFYVGKAFVKDVLKHSPVDEVGRIAPRPVLLVHGTEDEKVPFENARRLYGAAGQPRRLIAIEGGDHVFTKWQHMNRVFEETSFFLQRSLHVPHMSHKSGKER